MDRIEEIRERLGMTQQGPWACELEEIKPFHSATEYDQAFVSHAREDIPWLLERVGELENTIERMTGKLKAERDYQTELKVENEALHAALKASGERREQVEAENRRLDTLFWGVFEKMDAFKEEWQEDSAIHPQSE